MKGDAKKEESKRLLTRVIEEIKERERKIKKIKEKLLRQQEKFIEEAD